MNIAVCMKQTPDTEATIKITGDGNGIEEQNIKWIMNPYDEYAVEVALRLKEKYKGEVTVITMGPDRVTEAMRTALAMGADKGINLNDAAFENSDAMGQAAALAAAVKELNPDVLLCGRQAIDWDMGQVPAMIATILEWPCVTGCSGCEMPDEKTLQLKRKIEGGEEVYDDVALPAVISVDKGLVLMGSDPIQEARYASLPGIMKAKKKPIDKKAPGDLGLDAGAVGDAGAKVKITAYEALPERAAGKVFQDEEVEDMVKKVVQLLREEAKVI